jgi:hypothetical protein
MANRTPEKGEWESKHENELNGEEWRTCHYTLYDQGSEIPKFTYDSKVLDEANPTKEHNESVKFRLCKWSVSWIEGTTKVTDAWDNSHNVKQIPNVLEVIFTVSGYLSSLLELQELDDHLVDSPKQNDIFC